MDLISIFLLVLLTIHLIITLFFLIEHYSAGGRRERKMKKTGIDPLEIITPEEKIEFENKKRGGKND